MKNQAKAMKAMVIRSCCSVDCARSVALCIMVESARMNLISHDVIVASNKVTDEGVRASSRRMMKKDCSSQISGLGTTYPL